MACCETPKGSLSSVTEAGPALNRARIALRVGSDNAANVRLNESTTIWLCDCVVYVKPGQRAQSVRNAVMGLTRITRRAGTMQAAMVAWRVRMPSFQGGGASCRQDRLPNSRRPSPASCCSRQTPATTTRGACTTGSIDKRPALIARCRGTADVVDAVKLARSLNLEIAVRGGGHNVAGRGDDRRRRDDRPRADEGHPRRPDGADRPRAGRRALERVQPRDAAPRPGDDRRRRRHDGHRRADARRRPRLADAEIRARARQPADRPRW